MALSPERVASLPEDDLRPRPRLQLVVSPRPGGKAFEGERMKLTIVVQNLGHGGLRDADGNPQDRWPLLAERINTAADRVDVVLLSEVVGWDHYGHKQLARAMDDLGLDALPLAPSRSGYGTAVLYRPEVLGRWKRWNTDFSQETLHGFGVAAFEIEPLPALLSFVPIHLTPNDPDAALGEAGVAATRGYKYGPFVLLAGDGNYPPAADSSPTPNYSEMRPYNIGSRTLMDWSKWDGSGMPPMLGPDRRVSRKFVHNGYVDVAQHLYNKTRDERLLAPTSTDDRIDIAWVSRPLVPALVSYRRLPTPTGASDHDGLVIVMDTDLINVSSPWIYR